MSSLRLSLFLCLLLLQKECSGKINSFEENYDDGPYNQYKRKEDSQFSSSGLNPSLQRYSNDCIRKQNDFSNNILNKIKIFEEVFSKKTKGHLNNSEKEPNEDINEYNKGLSLPSTEPAIGDLKNIDDVDCQKHQPDTNSLLATRPSTLATQSDGLPYTKPIPDANIVTSPDFPEKQFIPSIRDILPVYKKPAPLEDNLFENEQYIQNPSKSIYSEGRTHPISEELPCVTSPNNSYQEKSSGSVTPQTKVSNWGDNYSTSTLPNGMRAKNNLLLLEKNYNSSPQESSTLDISPHYTEEKSTYRSPYPLQDNTYKSSQSTTNKPIGESYGTYPDDMSLQQEISSEPETSQTKVYNWGDNHSKSTLPNGMRAISNLPLLEKNYNSSPQEGSALEFSPHYTEDATPYRSPYPLQGNTYKSAQSTINKPIGEPYGTNPDDISLQQELSLESETSQTRVSNWGDNHSKSMLPNGMRAKNNSPILEKNYNSLPQEDSTLEFSPHYTDDATPYRSPYPLQGNTYKSSQSTINKPIGESYSTNSDDLYLQKEISSESESSRTKVYNWGDNHSKSTLPNGIRAISNLPLLEKNYNSLPQEGSTLEFSPHYAEDATPYRSPYPLQGNTYKSSQSTTNKPIEEPYDTNPDNMYLQQEIYSEPETSQARIHNWGDYYYKPTFPNGKLTPDNLLLSENYFQEKCSTLEFPPPCEEDATPYKISRPFQDNTFKSSQSTLNKPSGVLKSDKRFFDQEVSFEPLTSETNVPDWGDDYYEPTFPNGIIAPNNLLFSKKPYESSPKLSLTEDNESDNTKSDSDSTTFEGNSFQSVQYFPKPLSVYETTDTSPGKQTQQKWEDSAIKRLQIVNNLPSETPDNCRVYENIYKSVTAIHNDVSASLPTCDDKCYQYEIQNNVTTISPQKIVEKSWYKNESNTQGTTTVTSIYYPLDSKTKKRQYDSPKSHTITIVSPVEDASKKGENNSPTPPLRIHSPSEEATKDRENNLAASPTVTIISPATHCPDTGVYQAAQDLPTIITVTKDHPQEIISSPIRFSPMTSDYFTSTRSCTEYKSQVGNADYANTGERSLSNFVNSNVYSSVPTNEISHAGTGPYVFRDENYNKTYFLFSKIGYDHEGQPAHYENRIAVASDTIPYSDILYSPCIQPHIQHLVPEIIEESYLDSIDTSDKVQRYELSDNQVNNDFWPGILIKLQDSDELVRLESGKTVKLGQVLDCLLSAKNTSETKITVPSMFSGSFDDYYHVIKNYPLAEDCIVTTGNGLWIPYTDYCEVFSLCDTKKMLKSKPITEVNGKEVDCKLIANILASTQVMDKTAIISPDKTVVPYEIYKNYAPSLPTSSKQSVHIVSPYLNDPVSYKLFEDVKLKYLNSDSELPIEQNPSIKLWKTGNEMSLLKFIGLWNTVKKDLDATVRLGKDTYIPLCHFNAVANCLIPVYQEEATVLLPNSNEESTYNEYLEVKKNYSQLNTT